MRAMKRTSCSRCTSSVFLKDSLTSNGKIYCEACAVDFLNETKASGQPAIFARNIDPSICALCGKDNTIGDFGFRKKLPLCETCGPKVERWPYPQWLRLSLAGLIILLAASLVHGRSYFHAGRELYLGEKLIKQAKFAEAEAHLKETVRIAPLSDKAVLLLAKAALLTGDVQTASKALQGHNDGNFEDGQSADFLEMKALWDRAIAAVGKINKAAELANQDGREQEAAKLGHEAAQQYPESPMLRYSARELDAAVAFAKKDYDGFLSIEQGSYAQHPDGSTAGGVANAWACKYAMTGDPESKRQAEEFFAKAEQLSQADPELQKEFEEYGPRIRYRIDSRQIITKREYDQKFRSHQKEKAAK